MSRRLAAASCALAACLAAWLAPAGVRAAERIAGYQTEVQVNADGSLDVTERITVHAEGQSIRRGIYRDFPTRYKDRYGNRVVVDFDVLDVTRNGRPEPWFLERRSNGVRVNTGNDDFLPVPADYTFALRYRTTRQVGFFADHDELYWNAIGTGWMFPIEQGSVTVRLPRAVPAAELQAEGYTGAQGQRGDAFAASIPEPGVARWKLTRPLAPYEGLTIVLSFPKGLVAEPTRSQRVAWFLRDNRGVLVALLGLAAMLLYCLLRWRAVGRDPAPGIVIARYEPPEGHSPAGLRYLRRMGYDTRCFSADVLAMAVDGALRIHREKKLLKDDWSLERLPGATLPADAGTPQRRLLDALFPGGEATLALKDDNASTLQSARIRHDAALKARYQPRYFTRNGGSVGIALAIGLASMAIAFVLGQGSGVPALIAIALLMVLLLIAFALLVRAPSVEGRRLMDEIEGLKRYLGVAERDELARMPGPGAPPPLDAARYQALLPYAVALDVEEAWTRKFTLAVGAAAAAAATASIGWYRGGPVSDLGSLSRAVGSSLSSQIASASTPPGSSSGGGGGGFSGGGGGGGGGGGR